MIEIKGKHPESDPVNKKIKFGNQCITLSGEEWEQLDNVMIDLGLKPNDALEEVLYAGLAIYNRRIRRIDRQ